MEQLLRRPVKPLGERILTAIFDLIFIKTHFPALHNHGIKGAHESKHPGIKERRAVSKSRRECRRLMALGERVWRR